jgi:hypothetical protein
MKIRPDRAHLRRRANDDNQPSNDMPKAKPVSLHPLSFHEALKSIISVDPDKVGITSKRRRESPKTPKPKAK